MAKIEVRDEDTKKEFMAFLMRHPHLRFMQAVQVFVMHHLNVDCKTLLSSSRSLPLELLRYDKTVDTFFWECDEMLCDMESEGDSFLDIASDAVESYTTTYTTTKKEEKNNDEQKN